MALLLPGMLDAPVWAQRKKAVTLKQPSHDMPKDTQANEETFLVWLARAVSSTESKYKPLSKKDPLDIIFSYYKERAYCYNAMLRIDFRHPGSILGLNDLLNIPNCWENPTADFWLALANSCDWHLSRMDTDYFVQRYIAVEEPQSIVRLALARYWMNKLLVEIDRRANLQDIGKDVWRSGFIEAFYQHKWKLIPKTYKVAGETEDDRFNRAFAGFYKFVLKKERTARDLVTNDGIAPLTSVLAKSFPRDWYTAAQVFLENDLKACVATFYPIIQGNLEAAGLDIFSQFRDYYETHGEIRFSTIKQKLPAQLVHLLKKDEANYTDTIQRVEPKTAIKLGRRFNPEKILIDKQEHILRAKALQLLQSEDPEFFDAHLQHGGNVSKIAEQLRVSRPTVYKRIEKIKELICQSLRIPTNEFPLRIQ